MIPSLKIGATIKAVIGAAAILLVGIALWIALRIRMTGIDQPYLMLLAQEVLFGNHQGPIDLPSSVLLHAPPLIASHWMGWPIIFSWNLYITVLCAISACIFAFRMNTTSPVTVMCLWFGLVLLLFNDAMIGQRDFFFAIFWYPYLAARLTRPTTRLAKILDVVSGALLSVPISVKFYLAAFVLLIDIPILLRRREAQSFIAFWAMVVGGVIQTATFFIMYWRNLDDWIGRLSVYKTIGLDYWLVWRYLISVPAIYFSLGAIVLLYGVNRWIGRSNSYVLACGASAVVCLVLSFMRGLALNYTLVPLYLAPVACVLHSLFSDMAKSDLTDRWRAVAVWRTIIIATFAGSVGAVLMSDTGLGSALRMKYFSGQSEYAPVGPLPKDQYMLWVEKNVGQNEQIAVIALMPGMTAAFDPVLSTIRLGRRDDSVDPILHYPLWVALASGDPQKIDTAWNKLINEISNAKPDWIILRRTTPGHTDPDFVKIIEKDPRVYSWLTTHYSRYDSFGPYVAYRRLTTAEPNRRDQ
jgi:hypothetical protein